MQLFVPVYVVNAFKLSKPDPNDTPMIDIEILLWYKLYFWRN